MADARCDLSDLPSGQCACRIHGPKPEPMEPGPAFEARYPGICAGCSEVIEPGQRICGSGSGGTYLHEECVR